VGILPTTSDSIRSSGHGRIEPSSARQLSRYYVQLRDRKAVTLRCAALSGATGTPPDAMLGREVAFIVTSPTSSKVVCAHSTCQSCQMDLRLFSKLISH